MFALIYVLAHTYIIAILGRGAVVKFNFALGLVCVALFDLVACCAVTLLLAMMVIGGQPCGMYM